MAINEYLPSSLVIGFFQLLNDHDIEYVLIKNVAGELPDRLCDGKDIDILVNLSDRNKFTELMKTHGFLYRVPPLGKDAGYQFGYQLPEYQFWQMRDIKQTFYIDASFKLMCKSLTPKFWVPLDEERINRQIWNHKVWDNLLRCWRIDDKILLVYLLARCIFDKKRFSPAYIATLEPLRPLLWDVEVIAMLETLFYRFTPLLQDFLQQREYGQICHAYLTFQDY